MPPAPTMIGSINVNVPGKGMLVVMVNGSGYCQNASTTAAEVADFETQIVEGTATPSHKGAGGLRVFNRIPKAQPTAAAMNIVPFNLSSQRTFSYSAAGAKTINLRLNAIKLDAHVGCYAYSLNMTAIFNSQ
jgi:hypothetical protein